MTSDLLTADFYAYEDLLAEDERKILTRVREFLATEIAPHVDAAWAKGEFPREFIGKFRDLGLGRVSKSAVIADLE